MSLAVVFLVLLVSKGGVGFVQIVVIPLHPTSANGASLLWALHRVTDTSEETTFTQHFAFLLCGVVLF